MAHAQSAIGHPAWVARYHWPEQIRFKHILKLQPFEMNGKVYVRLSARRYVPASVSIDGHVHVYDRPVRNIDRINTPVKTSCLWRYNNERN